jgi:ribonuclease HI
VNDTTVACFGKFLGDASNNVAEYEGALACPEHAVRNNHTDFCIRLDSMLVVKQLRGEWACRASNLERLYERAVILLQTLRNRPSVNNVIITHVYRDYNAEADALANQAIDGYSAARFPNGCVIDDNWTVFDSTRVRFLDSDGDVIMPSASM